MKIDIEKLNVNAIKSQFYIQLRNRFEELSINERLMHIKAVVHEVAVEEIGVAEHRVHYHWFDQECREAAKERKQARLLTIQNSDNLEI